MKKFKDSGVFYTEGLAKSVDCEPHCQFLLRTFREKLKTELPQSRH